MRKTIVSMLVLSAIVYSCKKDDKKSNNELLLGKWSMVSQYTHEFYNNASHRDTATYPAGTETVEFRNDGKVYAAGHDSNGDPYKDTSTYKLDGSNLIVDTYDTLKISNLSASDLQFYTKHYWAADDWVELWANYKK